MWSAGSDVWDVYVDTAGAAIAGRGGEVQRADGFAVCLTHISEQRSRWRRPRVRVWLSGALARPFLCGPVAGLSRWAEAQALATASANAATGFDGPCLVQLEDWPGEGAALAVAVESSTLSSLQAAACKAGVALCSVRPWWASALAAACQFKTPPRLLAVTEYDALTVVGGSHGSFDLASSYVPGPAGSDAEQLLARLTLTQGIADERVAMASCALDREEGAWPSARWGWAA